MAEQVVQLAGAVIILSAFALSQVGFVDSSSARYLAPNVVGSALLAGDAYNSAQWGFVLLEGAWAAISAVSWIRKARSPSKRSAATQSSR